MTEPTIQNFARTDNDNCRVYYRIGTTIRCFQEDRPGQFAYYFCSRSGEPEVESKRTPPPVDRLPDDDSSTATAFRKWWKERA